MLLSLFCSSAFLALLAQEHSLCCDDLGAAFNSDVAFLVLHLFGELGKSSVHFFGLNNFSLKKPWAQAAGCTLLRWMPGFLKVDKLHIPCPPTAVTEIRKLCIRNTHSVLTWEILHGDRGRLTLACTASWWPPSQATFLHLLFLSCPIHWFLINPLPCLPMHPSRPGSL